VTTGAGVDDPGDDSGLLVHEATRAPTATRAVILTGRESAERAVTLQD